MHGRSTSAHTGDIVRPTPRELTPKTFGRYVSSHLRGETILADVPDAPSQIH